MRRRGEDPRIMAARALTITRQTLYLVRRARWRAKRLGEKGEPLLRELMVLELLLERIALRLETIVASGIVSRDLLRLPLELAREGVRLGRSAPLDLSTVLMDLEATLTTIYEMIAPPGGPASLAEEPVSEDAQRILDEVRREAERRVREELKA